MASASNDDERFGRGGAELSVAQTSASASMQPIATMQSEHGAHPCVDAILALGIGDTSVCVV